MTRILIRADSSPSIGQGHVMRCLALAEAWIDGGGEVHWLARDLLAPARDRLASEGIRLTMLSEVASEQEDASRTAKVAGIIGAAWVVLDGYALGALHQATLRDSGRRVLSVDDNGDAPEYTADIVLNQNAHAERTMYTGKERGSLFLLGPRYALLRREFRAPSRAFGACPEEARNLLVMLGGAGNARLANVVVDGLRGLGPGGRLMVRLALGSAAQAGEVDLRGTADWLSASPYIEDMPAAQAWADLAVSAAGSTVYELMRMGVPSIVVSVAENQRATARALGELGIAVDLGGVESLEPEAIEHAVEGLAADRAARLRMSERGRVAVDGQGALRVRKAMQTRALTLRPARDEDVKQIWEWANEPETRAVSFSTSLIPWEDHVRWFATHMEEANHRMFIAETADGKPVGIVRFELAGDHAVISVGIDHAMRNGGFGRWLIHLGSREALQSVGVRVVYAYIKPDNAASVQAFESAGFQLHSRSAVRGQDALLFTLARCGS